MIAGIPGAEGITYEAATLAGVQGHWCRPPAAPADRAILYLHGSAFVLGSAAAYRNFAGQFAARTGTAVFVADYGLAPERPFPHGVQDARAVWQAMQQAGYQRIAIVGDSAGGGLSLSLLERVSAEAGNGRRIAAVACADLSPWTDLALTGESHSSRAQEDLFITPQMLKSCVGLSLGQTDPLTPAALPAYGNPANLPPIQIHVGTAKVLLDDNRRFAARVPQAGGVGTAHVWQDMPHVFSIKLCLTEGRRRGDGADISLLAPPPDRLNRADP